MCQGTRAERFSAARSSGCPGHQGWEQPLAASSLQAGDAPSLETFKARLDGALSNLIQWKMSLLMAGR